MKKTILPILLVLLISCGKKTSEAYNWQRQGIHFICPENWKITEEETVENGAYYLSIEKRGWDESGLITLCIFDDSLDRSEVLKVYREALKDNFILKHADINFFAEKDSVFSTYESVSEEYTVELLGAKMEGIMHCFYTCNQTIYFLKQTEIGDTDKNAPGFATFERSFTCKE